MSVERYDHAGRGLWIGLALGTPLIGWGVRGILLESARTHPTELGRWIISSAVVHDAVVLPAALAVGVLVRRAVPAPAWPSVRWGLGTTAVIGIVAWPFVRGYGRSPNNPSLLPRDYGQGVLMVFVVVWLITGALATFAVRRGRRRAMPARISAGTPGG